MTERDIFINALQTEDPADRALYIEKACAGDAALRRRIERLLGIYTEASKEAPNSQPDSSDPAATYASPEARESASDSLPPVSQPSATRECSPAVLSGAMGPTTPPILEGPGTRIGPYKLLQKLGEGGMGAVYMAEQEKPVHRKVALKIIKPGMDSARIIARFEQERQALAMMDHPHIAKVLDAGTTPAGRPYFVMELVKGIPITKYCDHEHLTPHERIRLFIPVCQAVQHAHQKGIIHRDLKPSNVLIALYDGQPIPKVIDFGVAKATTQKLTERTMFTEVGQVIGTLEYMAPEQAELNNLDIDTRADIYSLGVILYELLTGSPPFTREQLRGSAFTEVVRMLREVEPPRPSTRLSSSEELPAIAAKRKLEPRKLKSLVHGELDWVVMKALEKDRARRYETANGLAMDLQRYLNDEPVAAGPPGAAYRLRRVLRRNKGPAIAAGLVAIALVVGVVVSTWQAVRARAAEATSREQREAALKAEAAANQQREAALKAEATAKEKSEAAIRSAAQAEAVGAFLTKDLLGQASPDLNRRDQKLTVEQLLDRASKNIANNPTFADRPEVEAAIRQVIGNTYFKLGALSRAETHLRRALELRRKTLPPEHPDALSAQEDLAWFLLGGVHYYEEGAKLSRETWETRRRVLGPDDRATLNSMDTYGSALGVQGKFDEAEAIFRQCWEARQRVLGKDDPDTLTTMGNLGYVLNESGRWTEAVPLLRACLDNWRRVSGLDKEDSLACLNNFSFALMQAGRAEEAEKLLREGLELSRASRGPEHINTAHLQHILVRVLHAQGRDAEAESLARETLTLRRKILPPGHENLNRSLVILGRILLAKGRAQEAEPLLREAFGEFQSKTAMKPNSMAEAGEWLGACLLALGRAADAEPPLRDALKIREQHMPQDWTYFHATSLLGAALAGQKKFAEGEPLVLAGYEGLKSRAGKIAAQDRFFLRDAANRVAQFYESKGEKEKAEEWRKRSAEHGH